MLTVPKVFQTHVRAHFPSFQIGEELEWHAWNYFKREPVRTSYSYLPVMWCPYYVTTAKYARDPDALKKLTSFLSMIKGKVITTNIYDGWPIDTRDMVVFSGSGRPDHAVPIPLICDPHPDAGRDLTDRNILMSMLCSYGTHPVRSELISYFCNMEDCTMLSSEGGKHSIPTFRGLMKNSIFALSPRGSGKTSFRMYEALQYNCIPVYVSDVHWLPFADVIDWDKLAVIWPPNNFDGLYKKLHEIVENRQDIEMRKYGALIYDKFFTYKGCFNEMKRIIERDYR